MSSTRLLSLRTLSCILLLLLGACLCFIPISHGEEVELTAEWQLLGENDTVPAGAHIRMDLTTGGRWAKLVEDDNDAAKVESLLTGTVQVDSSGGIVAVHEDENKRESRQAKNDPNYDFNMMHRALSKLSPEELERMGGLPELLTTSSTLEDTEQRQAFESRMKEIWERRQAELVELQEEFMADMPKMLLARIRSIDDYLGDPQVQLQNWKDSDMDEGTVSHILPVLQDLEHQLSDVDVTRDFHTLGGWPKLVSLLSDGVHLSVNETTLSTQDLERVSTIQAYAAWAMGTAVKNIQEFSPYAVDPVFVDNTQTTPIKLLTQRLSSHNSDSFQRQKILYGLGSLLRGNRLAQAQFRSMNGPSILSQLLLSASDEPKLTKRTLSLADDIVSDVVLHPSSDEMTDASIIQAFTSDEWCQSFLSLLQQQPAVDETALRPILTMAPYCKWDKKLVQSSIAEIKANWQEKDTDMDERLELVDSILELV